MKVDIKAFVFFFHLRTVTLHFLPIVDLTELTQTKSNTSKLDDGEVYRRKAEEMGKALSTFGFLYVTGHGIDDKLIKDSFQTSKDFFINHADVHKQYRRKKGVLLGYVDGENEKDFPDRPSDLKKAYDVVEKSPEFDAIPKGKDVLSNLWSSFRTTSDMILRLIALSTNQASDYFSRAHKHVGDIDENSSSLRLLYYPSTSQPAQTNQSRISEHTDFGTFTMLLQDSVGGLEVLAPDGRYREAEPIKNALVINVGDLLQLWSNNYFQSTVHRVVAKQHKKPRQSIAFFTNPDNNYVINCLYGKKSVFDHINERNNATVFDN